MTRYSSITLLSLLLFIFALSGCKDEIDGMPGYVESGMEMVINLSVEVPDMEVRSRASIGAGLNTVNSVWIATYSATTGEITSMGPNGGWYEADVRGYNGPHADGNGTPVYPCEIKTVSGQSYIVAVANVENMGLMAGQSELRPLSELLAAASTWEAFLSIGVPAPSTYEQIYSPSTPLVMAGCYVNGSHPGYDSWENADLTPYFIPVNGSGQYTMPGAIHLRRVVSQITFNLIPGDNLTITPHSYRVFNAPRMSWLYERRGNFGDVCKESDKDNYYSSPNSYSSSYITRSGDSYTFNFWQAENKHTGLESVTDYNARDKYTSESGDKIFTGLNSAWTPNNMASYVLINCDVAYKNPLTVDADGEASAGGSTVHRTGTAKILVHLGYVNGKPRDFNCFRNVDYTYNLHIDGIDAIRLEAVANKETPGIEGQVSDLENPTIFLDCHYQQYNVHLTDTELSKWELNAEEGTSKGFGFIILTYDNLYGGAKTYDEAYFVDNFPDKSYNEIIKESPEIERYTDWIEFMPTTGENVYAKYSPRGNGSGATFNMIDASQGKVVEAGSPKRSSSGWYTVFVKEYTYAYSGTDESDKTVTGNKPQWFGYVNADPRQFFIRVTKAVSDDGQSLYARAKYGTQQQSINTYYSTENITGGSSSMTAGSALGIENVNESFGLNLRMSFSPQEGLGLSSNNGRYNLKTFTDYTYRRNNWSLNQQNKQWNYFINPETPQRVPATNSGDLKYLPQIYNYRPSAYNTSKWDPQPNSTVRSNYIEAISACINRNRDNNGDGNIDVDEIRWYVPTNSKYVRITIGAKSLGANALIDFNTITERPTDIGSNDHWGRYFFYASDNRILWAMEGLSSGEWKTDFSTFSPPWQVRCIRNLGINLKTVSSEDRTVPAYSVVDKKDDGSAKVKPDSYQVSNLRGVYYSGNGTGIGQMPVHSVADFTYNSIYINGFEVEPEPGISAAYSGYNSRDRWEEVRNLIDGPNNPCTKKGDGWRLPNSCEIAIMQSEGLIKFTESVYDMSCSMAPFSSEGKKVTPYDNLNVGLRYFIRASNERVIQGDGDKKFFMRCVRDIR